MYFPWQEMEFNRQPSQKSDITVPNRTRLLITTPTVSPPLFTRLVMVLAEW